MVIKYNDGREAVITQTASGTYEAKGTKLNNQTLSLNYLPISKNDEFEITNLTFNMNTEVNSDGKTTFAAPCSQHPSNEEFDDCFLREWKAFCDGFVGCFAQATNPHAVALAIAIHCVSC